MSEHYVIRKVQQALDDELSRGGMRAGLPKVALPVDQVQWLLNAARSPLSQETVERIRRCIELREHRDLDVWAEHEAEPMLRDLLAEIEGKQS